MLGVAALSECTFDQLGERPPPRGSALGLKARTEPNEPVTIGGGQANS
jgi:hypothetical protein